MDKLVSSRFGMHMAEPEPYQTASVARLRKLTAFMPWRPVLSLAGLAQRAGLLRGQFQWTSK